MTFNILYLVIPFDIHHIIPCDAVTPYDSVRFTIGPKHTVILCDMEYRIFVPIIDNSKSTDYIRLLNEILRPFDFSVDNTMNEIRDDSYFVTDSSFGLKYRNEKKLELKVRTRVIGNSIEEWFKYKIRQESFSSIQNQVGKILSSLGYSERDLSCLENPTMIKVAKSRKSMSINSYVSLEVCHLTINGTNTSVREWISFCWEGDLSALQSELKSSTLLRQLRHLVSILELLQSVLPVVSGYPLWIKYIDLVQSNDSSDKRETIDEITSKLQVLVNS